MRERVAIDKVPVRVKREETADLVKWCNRLCDVVNELSVRIERLEREKEG